MKDITQDILSAQENIIQEDMKIASKGKFYGYVQ